MHARRQLRLASALALLAAVTPTGLAIDPKSPVSSYRRTTFTTEDGLAANVINDILQPRDGSLWIATYNGLTRFDGQHFTHVPFPKLRINVYSMTEGPDGDLWLGTRAGIFRISPRLLEQPGDPHVTVYHLGPDGDDTVRMVGSDATARYGQARGEDFTDGTAPRSSRRLSADSRSIASQKHRTATSSCPIRRGAWSGMVLAPSIIRRLCSN